MSKKAFTITIILLSLAGGLAFSPIGSWLFAQPINHKSEHFEIYADSYTSSLEEVEELTTYGEALYFAIETILPEEVPLTPVIVIHLNGRLAHQAPYVDGQGDIQLYRYPAEEGGYKAMLPHELVHAIAFDYALEQGALEWASLGFYNEAWAEFLAQVIAPSKNSFPLYGFNDDVIAGYWAKSSRLSMEQLRKSHSELNMRCLHEAYVMRASWIKFINKTYGQDKLLRIMYQGIEMTDEVVEEILGKSLSTIDQAWRRKLIEQHEAHPEAEQQTQDYLTRIGAYQPC